MSREELNKVADDFILKVVKNLECGRAYSGRGMYGESCLAITDKDFMEDIIMEAARAMKDNEMTEQQFRHLVGVVINPHTDSLGRGEIYYWRRIKVTSEDLPKNDDDGDDDDGY